MLHRLLLWWPQPADDGAAPRPSAPAVRCLATWPWLALLAVALWPHARWIWHRLHDRSDDPLGLAADAVLVLALWRLRGQLRPVPRASWQLIAISLALWAAVAHALAPPLFGAALAALAAVCGLRAVLPARAPWFALLGLALLALPLIASMQFYAGFPLRVVTAEASAWLLRAAGWTVERSGTALTVDGSLVIVDAPCSGVQMVWLSYFSACATAWWLALPDRIFLSRLALVGLLVLGGNVLRNSVLVALEVGSPAWADRLHEGVGLVVQAMVCVAVVRWMSRVFDAPAPAAAMPPPRPAARTERWVDRAAWMSLLACALLPLWTHEVGARPASEAAVRSIEWPNEWPIEWDGRPLRPIAPTALEERAERSFPGRIVRLTDGRQTLMWRGVPAPTRALHPAADCYRALGYRVEQARLERDERARLWRCFTADRAGSRLRVCERIEDAAGRAWTDASAWYWAAAMGGSTGPWQAITTARPL